MKIANMSMNENEPKPEIQPDQLPSNFKMPFELEPGDTLHSEIIQDDDKAKPRNARRANRMLAVQFLYGWDLSHSSDRSKSLEHFFQEQSKGREHYQFAELLINGVLDQLNEVDETIKSYAQNWHFSRIAKVDLAVLRLAIYELQYRRDIPPIVSINEALDIASIYSHPDAKRFINGVLDRVKQTLDRPFRTAAED